MILTPNRQRGMTLIEVLIAITLVGLLMTGMLFAMRISFTSLGKANDRMIANRRVTGAQRVLEQEIAGLIPVAALTPAGADGQAGLKLPFFQGESQSMRFVSTYSLRGAARGVPQILEFQVVPGGESGGVRLIVNEWPYTGSLSAGAMITGRATIGGLGLMTTFRPIEAGPGSFVLADKLASCRFFYQEPLPKPDYQRWDEIWIKLQWPTSIRIEMQPLSSEPGQLKMTTVTAPVHVTKAPLERYEDQ
jgi:prepilin-type N-terminal cleavage/methylation domain-containing protein